jgi:MerR family transcriptional regulator/heat shock protein HspR
LSTLQRIQGLTTDGLNLAGVKRVLDLEHRVAQLEGELAATQAANNQAVNQVHRQYRRDLVPLRQAVTLYKR